MAAIDRPASQFIGHETAISSTFRIEVKPGAKAYRYDVKIEMEVPGHNGPVVKSLTKGGDE
jgi:hypothetical protein